LKYLTYSNTAPIIDLVSCPLDPSEALISIGGAIGNETRFKIRTSSREKDLNKVRFWLVRSGVTVFDRTFDYQDETTLGTDYWKEKRYDYTESAFKWNSTGTMLMRPVTDGVPQTDEFVCVWGSRLEDGDYKLMVEAWDMKDAHSGQEMSFTVSGGIRSN